MNVEIFWLIMMQCVRCGFSLFVCAMDGCVKRDSVMPLLSMQYGWFKNKASLRTKQGLF